MHAHTNKWQPVRPIMRQRQNWGKRHKVLNSVRTTFYEKWALTNSTCKWCNPTHHEHAELKCGKMSLPSNIIPIMAMHIISPWFRLAWRAWKYTHVLYTLAPRDPTQESCIPTNENSLGTSSVSTERLIATWQGHLFQAIWPRFPRRETNGQREKYN